MAGLDSRFAKGVGALVAASLLAGVSMDAAATGGRGTIDLAMSNSGGFRGFTFVNPADNKTYSQEFRIQNGTKCIVDDDDWKNSVDGAVSGATGPSLVKLEAIRATMVGDNSGVGLVAGSLGVYDTTKGASCGKMTDVLEEGLIVTPQVGAFDEIRLDMEVSGNGRFKVIIDPKPGDPKNETDKHVYTLYSGTDIELNSATDELQEYSSGKTRFACKAGSDSGPNSTTNDNCQWRIKDIGTSFALFPVTYDSGTGVNGEGSLEGGGDYVDAGVEVKGTQILLSSTVAYGTLGCDDGMRPDGQGGTTFDPTRKNNVTARVYSDGPDTAASCQVTRVDTVGDKESCDLVKYRLETFVYTPDSKCRLDKLAWVEVGDNGIDHQIAGSMQVTFEPEARADWDIRKSFMTFTKDEITGAQTDRFYLQRCGGTVAPDSNGTLTLPEVLGSGLNGTTPVQPQSPPYELFLADGGSATLGLDNDAVPYAINVIGGGTAEVIDWACVLDNTELYEGDAKMRVIQTILFWGDALYGRF